MVTIAPVEEVRETADARPSNFRPDIEGLRALAILPVLAFHMAEFVPPSDGVAGTIMGALGRLSGGFLGVDVFFVISGFLITGILVVDAQRTGTVHFGRFYARRARRILPAATATLLVTLIASLVLLPAARAGATALDVLSAALFNSDIRFANSGVDYMGVATDPSPVLNFWSLSDEEKFYVVWPVVLLLGVWVAKKRQWSARRIALIAMIAIAIPSLVWSQYLVATGDSSAYFTAPSRAFELAIGGILAIGFPLVKRLPRWLRVVLPIVGLVVVVGCMFTYTTGTSFPGLMALPVVLGTCLILIGHERGIVARGLSTAVPRWFGRISYSLYLWHWPILVLLAAAAGAGTLTATQALVAGGASIGVGWVSRRWLEVTPHRASWLRSTRNALLFGLVAIVVTVGSALAVNQVANAAEKKQYAAAADGITPVVKPDNSLLFIGDSVTTRGQVALETALGAGGWDYSVDALGGRPIQSGRRATWNPLCYSLPACGGDLVLAAKSAIAKTVVISLGSNSMATQMRKVGDPTPTDSGLRRVRDAQGRFVISGQDSPEFVTSEVKKVMSMVPSTTEVYWVGVWLDDSMWGNVTWRANNRAMQKAALAYPNGHYLDYAAYVESAKVPYSDDGSHPTPEGMTMRARWLASQLK